MAEDITGNSPLVGYRPPWQGPEIAPGLLEHGMKLGEQAVNAFATGVAANAKQRQVENAYAALQLRNQKLEQDRELDYAKFGLAQQVADWKHDKDKQQIDNWGDKLELADRAVTVREQLADLKAETKTKQLEAIAGAQMVSSQLESEGIFPGDPRYESEMDKRLAQYAAAGPAFIAQTKRNAFNRHKFQVESDRTALASEQKNLNEDIGRDLFGGNYTIQNYEPLRNPEKFVTTTTEGGFGGGWFSIGGKKVPSADIEKGTGTLTIPKYLWGGTKDAVVSMKTVNDLKKRLESIEAKRAKLPPPVSRPELGIYPDEARSMQERAQRIINDPFATPEAKAAASVLLEGNQTPASASTGYHLPGEQQY